MKEMDLIQRDNSIKHFLNPHLRSLVYGSYEEQDEFVKRMLGTDNPEKTIEVKWKESPEEAPDKYLNSKSNGYHRIYEIYSRIFDLCKVLGITHVYDIGCEKINQSFLLAAHTNISYTAIDTIFELNDWREEDKNSNRYWHYCTYEAPPPFCDGRIRFIKGRYPDTGLDVKPNHIAVASCSLTMCRGAESINRAAAALVCDFDRILINFPSSKYRAEDYEYWKNADWSGYEIHPIDYSGFVYATRHEEDIERMKVMYPFDDDEIFDTGITSFKKGDIQLLDITTLCTDWVHKKDIAIK